MLVVYTSFTNAKRTKSHPGYVTLIGNAKPHPNITLFRSDRGEYLVDNVRRSVIPMLLYTLFHTFNFGYTVRHVVPVMFGHDIVLEACVDTRT